MSLPRAHNVDTAAVSCLTGTSEKERSMGLRSDLSYVDDCPTSSFFKKETGMFMTLAYPRTCDRFKYVAVTRTTRKQSPTRNGIHQTIHMDEANRGLTNPWGGGRRSYGSPISKILVGIHREETRKGETHMPETGICPFQTGEDNIHMR